MKQLLLLLSFCSCTTALCESYYLNALQGNDANAGTSIHSPWRTLERANRAPLVAGDQLLLAAGQTFSGCLILVDRKGTADKPIQVSSYPLQGSLDSRARIDARGHTQGVLIKNSSHVVVSNLDISASAGGLQGSQQGLESLEGLANMRVGALVLTTRRGDYRNITLCDLYIHDVFMEEPGFQRGSDEVNTANGTQRYGWGIRVINRHKKARISGIKLLANRIHNVAHTGIKFTGGAGGIHDILVADNRVTETGGPGIQGSLIEDAVFRGNRVNRSGSADDSRKWGRGSGLWVWGAKRVLIEKSAFLNANGPGDSAGVHIDYNCTDVIVQHNLSANNAGGFYEVLGNNYNTAYRYNLSINDGHRVKGENGAFQEGKTFWLSGFQGNRKRKGPFNSYFYNNTIYVDDSIVSKVAVDRAADGVLVANNIFYIKGKSQRVLGDQYSPEKTGKSAVQDVLFKNNLFLRADSWPEDVFIRDSAPLYGDPLFAKPGGMHVSDYLPTAKALVKDRGIAIENIPGDRRGLFLGLKVEQDILGNPVTGKPDMGAIELHK